LKIENVGEIDPSRYRAGKLLNPSAASSVMERSQVASSVNSVVGLVNKQSLVEP
jgi:hypothetical protein